MEIPNAHHKAMASHHLEEVMLCPNKTTQQQQQQQQQERKARPHPEQALRCPRCASSNTKFCYYNNYSLSQPRYFCKGCRRYWTQGGSLRNVPVGGGCRKNKRSSSSSSKQVHETAMHVHATNSNPLLPTLISPALSYDPNDLTLAFASLQKQPTKQLGLDNHNQGLLLGHANAEQIPTAPINGFLDILRSGFVDTTACNPALNNFYYGFGANCNNVEVGGVVGADGGVLPSEHTGFLGATGSTVTSQGSCKDMDEEETKVLMGLPWQVASGNGSIAVDSGRDYWTGVGTSWHGLINSSLM